MQKSFLIILVIIANFGIIKAREFKHISPDDNPVSKYNLAWTDSFNWEVILVMDPATDNPNQAFQHLQDELVSKGGGVVYFPPGNYHFSDHLLLESNVVIRGAKPSRTDKFNPAVPEEKLMPIIDARDHRYELSTIFHFPEYNGMDRTQAFKGIRSKDPANAENMGVIDLELRNGHILLGNREELQKNYQNSKFKGNILVYGNILKNSAVAGDVIPMEGQSEDQIWMDPELGAITVFAAKNIMVANNKIPKSGESNFLMKNYKLYPSREKFNTRGEMTSRDIWFDFDNRTGIRVNFMPLLEGLSIWKDYKKLDGAWKNGEKEKYLSPGTLARGIIIRDNYVFSSGKGGIKSTGYGTQIAYNVIRCIPELELPGYTGQFMDAFVNDTRAIEVRGWEWIIEGNDYEVYSNYTPEGVKYNDGEGIMHESWENVGIRNSILRNNVGNQYLCFWRVPVNGLLIEGNRIRTKLEWHAIYVNGQTRFSRDNLVDLPVNNVIIRNNITEGGGIKVLGSGSNNIIENNIHVIEGEADLIDETGARIGNNEGYELIVD